MLKPYAVHILKFSVSLPDLPPLFQKWIQGGNLTQEIKTLDFNHPRDLITGTGKDAWADAYEAEVEEDLHKAAGHLRETADKNFMTALYNAVANKAILPVRGAVYLTSSISRLKLFNLSEGMPAHEIHEHFTICAVNAYEQGVKPDWRTDILYKPYGPSLSLYKTSVWLDGKPQALNHNNDTHQWQTLAPEKMISHQHLRVDDAAINPAMQPSLQRTPFMGFSPYQPPKPHGLA